MATRRDEHYNLCNKYVKTNNAFKKKYTYILQSLMND